MHTLILHQFSYLILCLLTNAAQGSLCTMPRAWHGSWYQHGMNSLIEININHVQTKGHCLDVLSIQSYYLFFERSIRCMRCLLWIERHVNLLQYRESECYDTDDLVNVTSCPTLIAPDAVLYTLHRNNSQAESCPIHPPYLVTQLIKDGSICHQSISSSSSSSIDQCANDYQFHLYLHPCLSYHPIIDHRHICVGTWTENVHTYFVTRLIDSNGKGSLFPNYFACFRYLTKQSSFSLSMAMDDSCHDLNAKQMSTSMTLSWNHTDQNRSCHFPREFQSNRWISINQTLQIVFTDHDVHWIGMEQRFHCVQLIDADLYRIEFFVQCQVMEKWLRISRRTEEIIELEIISSLDSIESTKYSSSWIFVRQSLITSDSISVCPSHIGHLIYQSNLDYYSKRQSLRMSIGCDEQRSLIVTRDEKLTFSSLEIQRDQCLAHWQSNDGLMTYLLVRSINSEHFYCLTFQMTHPILIRNNSDDCSFDSSISGFSSFYSAERVDRCSSHSASFSRVHYVLFLIYLFIPYSESL